MLMHRLLSARIPPPADYSILQIEGVGGLRLPRLTVAERNGLTLDEKAPGLVIFLDDGVNSQFQFWDGFNWISMITTPTLNQSINGITGDGSSTNPYKLGGDLTQALTQITQGNNNLYFDATAGTFSVGNNTFVVTDDGLGVGKIPSSTNGTVALDIKAESNETGFRYKSAEAGQVIKEGSVLVSDAQGNALWKSLEIKPVLREARFLDINGTPVPEGNPGNVIEGREIVASPAGGTAWTVANAEYPVQISDTITLSRGIWFITARYVMISNYSNIASTSNGYGYNTWIRLRDYNNPTVDIAVVGQRPQMEPYSPQNRLVASPQLAYLLRVESETSYCLYGDYRWATSYTGTGTTSLGTVKLTDPNYGKSYLRAVRLTDDEF